MPDDDWALSNGTVEFRQEERLWSLGRFECDRDDIDESADMAEFWDCGCPFEGPHGHDCELLADGEEDVE